jgi:glucoside 3-dehydrogenase (cytochrome c) catalytic subunit
MQTDQAGKSFDVVIVGSGASGGWVAKRLTEAGLRVVVLEAGRQLTDADYKEHVPAFDLKYRGRTKRPLARERPQQSGSYAVREWNADWYVNDYEEPYVDKSDPFFLWVRPRLVGGRTNIWGRACLRLSDIDFKAASQDGAGIDWPIGYKDIAPYYDLVEDYVGVSAMPEGLAQLPDGRFLPPMGLTCGEMEVRARLKTKFDRTLTQGRTANLTKPLNGRAACHYCGPCEHGCVTHSYFNAAFTTMADAMKTGRCTLITGAMAYKVVMDPATHRATGILYIDRATRQPKEVYGKVVALCAQTMESVRILFNSATRQDANGLANSSGVLGKYLMTHFSDSGASGELHDVMEKPALGGADRPCQTLLVRFRNLPGGPATKGFLRGYAYGGDVSPRFNFDAPGFGTAYKQAVAQPQPTTISLSGFGECLPYEDNVCVIDPNTVDAFGIPVVRLQLSPHENERAMLKDMASAAAEMLEGIGARNVQVRTGTRGQAHELGAARMGTDPKQSLLNPFLQTHDIRNLFVMDGSSFCSSAWQNPTLTIMALAVRATDYMQEQLRQGAL